MKHDLLRKLLQPYLIVSMWEKKFNIVSSIKQT